jgi:ABC-2 type transport system ATP-binding protein
MAEEILRAENVTKNYANHLALDGVSITVQKQRIFGLLGPNGAGKTSLIRIINQIIGPDIGKVYFKGRRLSADHIGKIGYLPEERGLYKKMGVGEQALYLAQLKGVDKKEAMKKLKYWFEKFDIQEWWSKNAEDLSKGMQQKVQFIIAVLHEPELLIFDEPFSGFDPINTELIKGEILSLRDKGATVIFSTHNMESVEELCDDIALIHNAEKILDGSVKEIQKAHQTNIYNIEFLGTLDLFSKFLNGNKLISHNVDEEKVSAQVQLSKECTLNDFLMTILPNVSLISCKESVPSMRDIFITSVKEKTGIGSA